MSAKSKNSSERRPEEISRPIAPALIKRAREMAPLYSIVLEENPEGCGGWGANVLEMPNVFGAGDTAAECVRETRSLLVTILAFMMQEGQPIPASSSENKRTEQLNLRLTAMEKARLEAASRSQGFRGLSDFIRAKALQGI